MKDFVQSASNWVLGLFVPEVDAGACVPPDCCRLNRRYACLGACTRVVRCNPKYDT